MSLTLLIYPIDFAMVCLWHRSLSAVPGCRYCTGAFAR